MAFQSCLRVLPPMLSRRLSHPVGCQRQQVRTLFNPWPRVPDIRALVRDMDRQMDRLEREMFRGMPSVFPRLVPVSGDITVSPVEGGGQYRVAVDLSGFEPEEVDIALDESGRKLTISAKCERSSKDGSRFAQELVKHVVLPERVDLSQLKSLLHTNGVLAIEAPYVPTEKQAVEPRQIPIARSGAPSGAPQQEQQIEEKSANSN